MKCNFKQKEISYGITNWGICQFATPVSYTHLDVYKRQGIGSEIIAVVHETKAFDYLRGPVQRVTAVDAPMPYAKILEDNMVPKPETIVKAVKKVMTFKWEWLHYLIMLYIKIKHII